MAPCFLCHSLASTLMIPSLEGSVGVLIFQHIARSIAMTVASSRRVSLLVALVAISWQDHCAIGFVNVPGVRKPALHSTSTSVTWEPTHVLTHVFQRNPFAGEEATKSKTTEESTSDSLISVSPDGSMTASLLAPENSLSQFIPDEAKIRGRTPWLMKYIQSEYVRRSVQKQMKVATHNFLRDSGMLRMIIDFLVTIGVPSMAIENPDIISRFVQLTLNCKRIPYGDGHRLQAIDMFLPSDNRKPRGLLFFVVSCKGSLILQTVHCLIEATFITAWWGLG